MIARPVLLIGVVLALSGCAASHHGSAASPSPANSHAASHPAAKPALHGVFVATAHWSRASQGYRLRVSPTSYGRRHAARGATQTLRQALAAAQPPPLTLSEAMHHSLLDQLRCHAAFAPNKPTWDLESWRPDVGYTKTVLAACNP